MYRAKKLTESARGQSCTNCDADDGTIVWAHSNWQEHGKGKSLKAHDIFGAHLCMRCHSWLDCGIGKDPTGIYADSRDDKREMWRRCFDRTLLRLVRSGVLA